MHDERDEQRDGLAEGESEPSDRVVVALRARVAEEDDKEEEEYRAEEPAEERSLGFESEHFAQADHQNDEGERAQAGEAVRGFDGG